jgi:hypothetical protein
LQSLNSRPFILVQANISIVVSKNVAGDILRHARLPSFAVVRYRGVHHFGCGAKLDSTRSIQFAPHPAHMELIAAALNTI